MFENMTKDNFDKILDSIPFYLGLYASILTILYLIFPLLDVIILFSITLNSLFLYHFFRQNVKIEKLKTKINDNEKQQCFIKSDAINCPLGIKKIIEKTENSIRESLEEANSSYQFLGLCAFNILNNNEDIFEEKRFNTNFEFVVVNPENENVLIRMDDWRQDKKATCSTKALSELGCSKLEELEENYKKFRVLKYDQLAKFRMVIIDESKIYLSFYDDEENVLLTKQLIIERDPSAEYNLFSWFKCYFDKSVEDLTGYDIKREIKNKSISDEAQCDLNFNIDKIHE